MLKFLYFGSFSLIDIFGQEIVKSFYKLCMSIDSIIYNVISWLYGVFITIAEAEIFTSETIKPFMDRVYLIVGIIALFFAAYTFLTLIINPDNLSSGNTSPAKMIKNVIYAILAVTFVPTIFSFAYAFQASVLKQNVIPKLLTPTSGQLYDNGNHSLTEFSALMFESSYYVKYPNLPESQDAVTCYDEARQNAITYNDISYYGTCLPGVYDDKSIQYNAFLSGVVGIVLVYIFASYCIDVGIRAIKLGLLQLIAPLPSLLLMVPGQDKVFKAWLKETIKTFVDVLLKIIIIVFGVYMVYLVRDWFDSNQSNVFSGASPSVVSFSKLFIFMGICIFIKRAPKLLKDLFGLDLGENGISLRKRVDEFKDSIAPVTNVASKTAGMVGGAIAAGQAYKQGLAAGNKGSFIKKGLATFHGLRNGWNGGIRNIGAAYNYEMETQRSYALDRNKSTGTQVKNAIFDSLRDNFGFQSRYNDEVRLKEIRRDALLADAYQDSREINNATSQHMRDIEDRHKYTTAANKNLKEKGTALVDDATAEVGKEDSKIFTTNQEMLDTKYRKVTDDMLELERKKSELSQDEYDRKKRAIDLEDAMLSKFYEFANKEKILDQSYNNFSLDKSLEAINKREDLSQDIKNAINFMYSEAKNQNVLKYFTSGEYDNNSKIKMDIQEVAMALQDNLAGYAHVFDEESGKYINKQIKDLKSILYDANGQLKQDIDFEKLLKIKKEAGIILDKDLMAKNEELANTKVSVNLTGGKGEQQYSLYELQRMQSQLTEYIDALNKEVERFIEARKSEEKAAEVRKNRDSNRPTHKSKRNNQ